MSSCGAGTETRARGVEDGKTRTKAMRGVASAHWGGSAWGVPRMCFNSRKRPRLGDATGGSFVPSVFHEDRPGAHRVFVKVGKWRERGFAVCRLMTTLDLGAKSSPSASKASRASARFGRPSFFDATPDATLAVYRRPSRLQGVRAARQGRIWVPTVLSSAAPCRSSRQGDGSQAQGVRDGVLHAHGGRGGGGAR